MNAQQTIQIKKQAELKQENNYIDYNVYILSINNKDIIYSNNLLQVYKYFIILKRLV